MSNIDGIRMITCPKCKTELCEFCGEEYEPDHKFCNPGYDE